MKVIEVNSLTKTFGSRVAVKNISTKIEKGDIFGFIGLNGAGKTTLIRMLLGMISPDSGSVQLFGKKLTGNFDQWNDIGYLVETPFAYPNLSVAENLKVYYQLRKLKEPSLIPAIIEKLKLNSYKDTKAKYLSLGNQQRLGLAKAMMHNPKLLILDEPVNALDPEGIVEVRELLRELAYNGSTIFLSSHILGEVSRIATRLGIIHEGNLVSELTTSELEEQLMKKLLIITDDNSSAANYLHELGYRITFSKNNEIEITDKSGIVHPERISKMLIEKGFSLKQLYLSTEDLEHFFLRTIKGQ